VYPGSAKLQNALADGYKICKYC